MLLAVDDDLGDHAVHVVGLLNGRQPVQAQGEPMKRAGRPPVALTDLDVGGEEDAPWGPSVQLRGSPARGRGRRAGVRRSGLAAGGDA